DVRDAHFNDDLNGTSSQRKCWSPSVLILMLFAIVTNVSKPQKRASKLVSTLLDGFARAGLNWKVLRNFGTLTGGSAIGQGFTVAVAPLITRLYLPDNLGQLGLFTAFINVAVLVA